MFLSQTFSVNAATGTGTISVTDYAYGTQARLTVATRDGLGPVVGSSGALGTPMPYLGFIAQTSQGYAVTP